MQLLGKLRLLARTKNDTDTRIEKDKGKDHHGVEVKDQEKDEGSEKERDVIALSSSVSVLSHLTVQLLYAHSSVLALVKWIEEPVDADNRSLSLPFSSSASGSSSASM